MAFIDYNQKVVPEVIKEGIRLLSSFSPIEMERVILNSLAKTCFFNHLNVIQASLLQSVGFNHPKVRQISIKFRFYRCDCFFDLVFRDYEVSCRINKEIFDFFYDIPCIFVNLGNCLDFIAKHLHTYDIVEVSRDKIDRIAPDPETPRHEFNIISLKLYRYKSF